MTKAMLRKGMLALPLKDRLNLVKDFDLAITGSEPVLQIPPSHMRHLEEVVAEYKKNPSALISHEEMKEHLKKLKRRLATKRASKSA